MESLGTSPGALPSWGLVFQLASRFHRYWASSSESTVRPKMESCFQDGACSVCFLLHCHLLLQGIFPTQGSNLSFLCLLHCKWIVYPRSHDGSPSKCLFFWNVAQSCLTLCDPRDYTVHGVLQARIQAWIAFPLLQQIFPTPESNWGLLHCRQTLYQLSYQGRNEINYTDIWGKIFQTEKMNSEAQS